MTKLVFKKNVFLKLSGLENPHQLALRSQVSSPTVNKYNISPEKIVAVDTSVLSSILLNGVGLSQEQILALKLGDIFEFVE
jgi:hypothetical protein